VTFFMPRRLRKSLGPADGACAVSRVSFYSESASNIWAAFRELRTPGWPMTVLPALRDLNKLNAFVRVAESRSFTKAAQDLSTSPSVISKHISDLERNLGFSLLTRSTHGVALTEAGEGLLQKCLKLLAGVDEYVIDTRNTQTGPYGFLRIQTASDYARWVLAPIVREFLKIHSQVRVEIVTRVGTAFDEESDIAIGNVKPKTPGLIGEVVGKVGHVICATPKYFEMHGRPKNLRELRKHNCLIDSTTAPKTSTAAGSGEWRFRKGSQVLIAEVKGSFCSDSAAVLRQMTLDHLGIARMPHYAIKAELADGLLEPIFQDMTSLEEMSAYYSKTKLLPAKVTSFLSFLRASLAEP
jgi:DNA-binding transcriptional LysR family regulator